MAHPGWCPLANGASEPPHSGQAPYDFVGVRPLHWCFSSNRLSSPFRARSRASSRSSASVIAAIVTRRRRARQSERAVAHHQAGDGQHDDHHRDEDHRCSHVRVQRHRHDRAGDQAGHETRAIADKAVPLVPHSQTTVCGARTCRSGRQEAITEPYTWVEAHSFRRKPTGRARYPSSRRPPTRRDRLSRPGGRKTPAARSNHDLEAQRWRRKQQSCGNTAVTGRSTN